TLSLHCALLIYVLSHTAAASLQSRGHSSNKHNTHTCSHTHVHTHTHTHTRTQIQMFVSLYVIQTTHLIRVRFAHILGHTRFGKDSSNLLTNKFMWHWTRVT